MSMTSRILDVAWETLATLLRDWQRQPYFWDREVDIQVALAARLTTAYTLLGRETVTGYYDGAPPGYEMLQRYSRVACEPPLRLHAVPNTKFLPDIVVWKDVPDPTKPPHAYEWPIHWVCELKYGIGKSTDWDEFKLQQLLDSHAADHACVVHILRETANQRDSIAWTKNGDVHICKARLPIRPPSHS